MSKYFPQGITGSGEVGQPYLNILARQHNTIRACAKGRPHSLAHIIRLGSLVRQRSEHVNIDSRVDLDPSVNTFDGSLCLSGNVICR